MYTTTNFKTKKSLKEALGAGAKITVFQPGLGAKPLNGVVFIEGPHFPAPHTFF